MTIAKFLKFQFYLATIPQKEKKCILFYNLRIRYLPHPRPAIFYFANLCIKGPRNGLVEDGNRLGLVLFALRHNVDGQLFLGVGAERKDARKVGEAHGQQAAQCGGTAVALAGQQVNDSVAL